MEQMIPSGMIPGLVTIKGKDGKLQNVWPIDAKELITSGEYELVENGSVEAARLNANPFRGQPIANPEVVVAEIAGIGGGIITAANEAETKKIIASGDNADEVAPKLETDEPAPETKTTATKATGTPTGTPAKTDTK